jgi:hypothetical protein
VLTSNTPPPKKQKQKNDPQQTPREAAPAFGCPAPGAVDTCPSDPGADSTSNFMQYTDDACMSAFTSGQVARMSALWRQYRAPIAGGKEAGAAAAPAADGSGAQGQQPLQEAGSEAEPAVPQRRRRRVGHNMG